MLDEKIFGRGESAIWWRTIVWKIRRNFIWEKEEFGGGEEVIWWKRGEKIWPKKRKKVGGGAEEIEGGLSGVLGCIVILRKICSLTSIVVIITIFLRSLAVARPAAVSIGSDRSRPSAQIFEETDDSSLDPRQPVHSPVAANWPPTNVQPTPTLPTLQHCATAAPPTLQHCNTTSSSSSIG